MDSSNFQIHQILKLWKMNSLIIC